MKDVLISIHRVLRANQPVAALAFLIPMLELTAPISSRASDSAGEFVISVFTGVALTQNNDLRLREPGGTDLTFHDVSYSGEDFHPPPYYGARLTYFLPEQSHWGFGLEFFHAKVYLDTGDTVHVTGSSAGVPVDRYQPVGDSIQAFVLHNGFNFATVDAFYRWFPGHREQDFLGRFQPYVGAGLGAVIPYVESQVTGGSFTYEGYQLHGPGVLGIVGTNFDLSRHFALFFEYKLSYADLGDMPIAGGAISMNPITHHLVSGVSFRF